MYTWKEEMIPLTRGLINDIDDSSYTYTDTQITKFLIYAAHLNQLDITFSNTYTIDISKLSISPDPTSLSDSFFINFTCMKAAILILSGELKTDASKAVSVSDGPSSIDYREVYKAKKVLYDDMIEKFGMAKVYAALGDLSAGVAILTPFTQQTIYTSNDRGI